MKAENRHGRTSRGALRTACNTTTRNGADQRPRRPKARNERKKREALQKTHTSNSRKSGTDTTLDKDGLGADFHLFHTWSIGCYRKPMFRECSVLGEFFVVADGQLDVARDDAGTLVVPRGVTRELESLRDQVFQHGGQVDGRAGADALPKPSRLEQPSHLPDRELDARLRAARFTAGTFLPLALARAAALAFARHGRFGQVQRR